MIIEPIYQRGSHDCGAAAVATVLNTLGIRRTLAAIARDLNTTEKDGTDPRAIEAYFRRLGFGVCSGSMTVFDLKHHTRLDRPVIALTQSHWVTVCGVVRNHVHFACPVRGMVSETISDFNSIWLDSDRFGVLYDHFGIAIHPAS